MLEGQGRDEGGDEEQGFVFLILHPRDASFWPRRLSFFVMGRVIGLGEVPDASMDVYML